MRLLNDVRRLDRRLTRQAASWESAWARRALPAVESAAEGTKLWWGMAGLMAATAGRSGRKAAAAGVLSMLTAQLLANAVGKQISDRRRPPEQLIPHGDVEDRPDTSSLPSGHTAAAVGFAAAVTASSPAWGVAAAVPAVMVALERVHSGAHYPSDVAVGTTIGLASACLINRAPRLLLRGLLP
ncbi:phosphatase PAP2 family protein [Streptomyces sp. V1I1]|uniref:phosphatase PAP2 family protein n=1 Tax=Streptomyces sp. V1I1 TaxID=3042272 RepID=UPI002784769B|nr:phosphatase PAP2 family protein [Streptomyces sp. V1I1]MDQ0938931.1 membrane-associated phospholipid phosphatase [Streptomyces sp. V1I1]